MPLNPPDINELRAIVDWVNLTEDVRELSIKMGDVELFVSRVRQPSDSGPHVATTVAAPVTDVVSAPAAPAPAALTPEPLVAPVSAGQLAPDEVMVASPMVGTFYSSPKPGSPPFVSVGDAVGESTVLGIVEVMMLMNNIEARVEGNVARILVENEQAVEYGQPLMVITRNG